MIQDIKPHQMFNQYLPDKKPDGDSYIVCFRGNEVLVDASYA